MILLCALIVLASSAAIPATRRAAPPDPYPQRRPLPPVAPTANVVATPPNPLPPGLPVGSPVIGSTPSPLPNPKPIPTLPPDPSKVATPVNTTVATDFATLAGFLYSGANPIQAGVTANTIDPQRVAVVRGRTMKADGSALPGATTTILNHPEFGQTYSRLDGKFDLAVNGGALLTVDMNQPNDLPTQRQVQVPINDFAIVSDVALVPADAKVTTINLTSGAPIQVARGRGRCSSRKARPRNASSATACAQRPQRSMCG